MDFLNDATAVERMLVEKANMAGIPITANFELTPVCDLNCDMCYIRTDMATVRRGGGLLPVERWTEWAQELKDMGTLFILLTGGEPMMHPGFKTLYTRLRDEGFILTINTNGTLIDEDTARMFGETKPRRVNVTLYGAGNTTYCNLCHSADGFDRCMNGLRLLKKHGVDTKMNVSVVRGNLGDYKQILELAQELDIPAEVNSYMFPYARTHCGASRSQRIRAERLTPEEAAAAEVEYMEYRRGPVFKQFLAEFNALLDNAPDRPALGLDCRAGTSSCWINWQGHMSPCCVMEEPMTQLTADGMTVAEAWRRTMEAAARLPKHDECAGCKLRPACNVCYAAACHEKRVEGNLSYLCTMAAKKKDILHELGQSSDETK